MRKLISIIILGVLIASTVNVQADQSLQAVNLDVNEIIVFDASNSSLAVTMLSNSQTQYDVTFYGSGWVFTEIDNWDNIGIVNFLENPILNFTNSNLNGTVTIKNDPTIGFIHTNVDLINFYNVGHPLLYLDDSSVGTMRQYQGFTIMPEINLVESEIGNIISYIYINSGNIDGLKIYGDAQGMNITIDELSTIHDGLITLGGVDNTENLEIEILGYKNIGYYLQLYFSPVGSQVNISDLIISHPSGLTNINNLTMKNIGIKYNHTGFPIVSFDNVNGTVDSMIDPIDNSVSRTSILNSNLHFINSEIATVELTADGDEFNPNNINKFTDTVVRRDFNFDAVSRLEHDNLVVLGFFVQKVVASGDSSWTVEESGSITTNALRSTILQTNLLNMSYAFKMLDTTVLEINNGSIHGLTGVNSSVNIYDSIIHSAEFGFNCTVSIHDSLVYGMKPSDNSSFSFFNTSFFDYDVGYTGGYVFYSDFSIFYFEDSSFNRRLELYQTNLSSVNSYFESIILRENEAGVYKMNFTDSIIGAFCVSLKDDSSYYWYFYNTTLDYIEGAWGLNIASTSTLHISLVDSEVSSTYEWDWGAVPDLTTVNTILGSTGPLNLYYYADGIGLTWSIEATFYGKSVTGDKTIQRREIIDGNIDNWETISTTTDSTYKDTTVLEGKFYDYQVLILYETDFMIKQGVEVFDSTDYVDRFMPALLPLVTNITGATGYQIDYNTGTALTHFPIEFYPPNGVDYTHLGVVVAQYELFLNGETSGSQVNITARIDGRIFIDLDLTEGKYHLKVRVSSDTVRFWSEWDELIFVVNAPSIGPVTTSEPTTNDEGFLPGFTFIYTLIAMSVLFTIRRKIRN